MQKILKLVGLDRVSRRNRSQERFLKTRHQYSVDRDFHYETDPSLEKIVDEIENLIQDLIWYGPRGDDPEKELKYAAARAKKHELELAHCEQLQRYLASYFSLSQEDQTYEHSHFSPYGKGWEKYRVTRNWNKP
jgi:hypothetical protein